MTHKLIKITPGVRAALLPCQKVNSGGPLIFQFISVLASLLGGLAKLKQQKRWLANIFIGIKIFYQLPPHLGEDRGAVTLGRESITRLGSFPLS